MYCQMMEYLYSHKLLHPNSHAYRKGHNTTTALASMYDIWTRSVDAGQATAAIVLDMSAAFDIIDRKLLLKKLSLMGFEENVVKWLDSYLSNRSQSVCINGVLSKLLPTDTGVPQGSILGPLLYTLYTLAVPEIIHKEEIKDLWPPYHTGVDSFDNVVVYADDTTINLSAASETELSVKLEKTFKSVSEYMVSQGLKLNDEKSHLLVFNNNKISQTVLKTPLGIIHPSESEKFLGGIVQKDLKWTQHILASKDNLVSTLNKRCNALRCLSRVASFKTRKTIANGIFMGKLSYLICIWGSTTQENLRALQIAQNRAARYVTRNWNAGTVANLRAIGWLSVTQLVFYHIVLLMFKIIQSRSSGKIEAPEYLVRMFNWDYCYDTRQADGNMVKPQGIPRLDVTRRGLRYKAAELFNQLPVELRKVRNMDTFKLKVKDWIRGNIQAKP